MTLDEIEDDTFLVALVNALESSLIRGLDTARRLGWDGETKLYRVGHLHRVTFIPEAERRPGEHEPDEFHDGIAPCVKLLHYVAERLVQHRAHEARSIIDRWRLTPSPIHIRLWAALARDSWAADADVVGQLLLSLNDRRFWDAQNFPEIAELRALRFAGMTADIKKNLAKRLRKTPPRNHWPRDVDSDRVAGARRYWAARELRRIEIAGGVLFDPDRAWLARELPHFPKLVAMTRLDEGFLGTPEAGTVLPQPDMRYDNLMGDARLSALETALGSARRGWNDDVSSRAWDWMRAPGNASRLIADFETSDNAGASFPKVWDHFSWAHSPAANGDGAKPIPEREEEVNRVLALLAALPTATASAAIEGLSNWLSNWGSIGVRSPHALGVWEKLWSIAVEVTNAAQPADAPIDLNLVAIASDDREPMDLDMLNTPVGRLVDMFLAACPTVDGSTNPFAADGLPRTMRETVIATSGRSGLMVRHRLVEQMPYFLRADAEWTRQHLISALLEDNADATSLWRALARRPQCVEVLKIIGSAMVMRASDLRLGREARRSLVFSLIVECLHALFEGREPVVPYASIQQMLRSLDDELRAHAAGAVQQFVRELAAPRDGKKGSTSAEDLFERAAAPFLATVWPQERSLSTPGVSKALADLPATTHGAFARAVNVIERFLVPFDAWSLLDYGLFGDEGGEPKLTNIDTLDKALALLRLLDATIGTAVSAVVPVDLAAALARIEKVAPALAQDPKFRRLAAATRR